jgi:endonuclease III
MYRAAREALEDECARPGILEKMTAAHQLFKRHGQELCRRSAPRCEACPLRKTCPCAGV